MKQRLFEKNMKRVIMAPFLLCKIFIEIDLYIKSMSVLVEKYYIS